MEIAIVVLLLVAAVIHLTPLIGVVSVARLESLYAITIDGPDLAVLMRHRAVLFGLLGALAAAAVVCEELRWAAVIGTLVSDLAFAALILTTPNRNANLTRLLRGDVVSIVALVAAGALLLAG